MTTSITEANKLINDKKLFLLDMDGTLYWENTLIDGASEFLESIISTGRQLVFMTNNSSKSAVKYVEKLTSLGIESSVSDIFTSGQASALYIRSRFTSPRIYLVGTEALRKEMESNGIDVSPDGKGRIDCVLVGYDTELTYKKLETACDLLCEDIPFLATNPDIVCPAKHGRFLPDCKTMCDMLQAATGKMPFYIGKPRKEMALEAVKYKGFTPDDAVLIGDRLYTDIQCGLNAGILTVLVLSGESTVEDIKKYSVEPDIILNGVCDIHLM